MKNYYFNNRNMSNVFIEEIASLGTVYHTEDPEEIAPGTLHHTEDPEEIAPGTLHHTEDPEEIAPGTLHHTEDPEEIAPGTLHHTEDPEEIAPGTLHHTEDPEEIAPGTLHYYTYRSKNGLHYFRFEYVNIGPYYEIDILSEPDYGGRDHSSPTTHWLPSERGGHKICVSSGREPTDLNKAQRLSTAWAELISKYICSGITPDEQINR